MSDQEIFEKAQECVADPERFAGYFRFDRYITWYWQVDKTDDSQGIISTTVTVDPDQRAIKLDNHGILWVRPHRLSLRHSLPIDGIASRYLEYQFPYETLGINPGWVPRASLAAMIGRRKVKEPLLTA